MAPADLHRRKILAAVSSASALALAGCSILDEQEQPPKLIIRNFSNQPATVSLTVRNAESGDVVIDDEVSLEPEGELPYDQPFTSDGEKSLTASLEGGGIEEYSWWTDTERGASQVAVIVQDDDDLFISHSSA